MKWLRFVRKIWCPRCGIVLHSIVCPRCGEYGEWY